ncbi:MAG: biotin carboxylase N-terminal domain-containing protein [Actinomycetota bacterium]
MAGGNGFTTLLIANRGEIARRIIRTAADMGLRTVAVFVDADADAPFVSDADEAVRIDGYLDVDAILSAATRTGAGAVHPGYGFLAENAGAAEAVAGARMVWVGPGPDAIRAMGDKIEAKALATAAGVPVLPSTDDEAAFDTIGFPLLIKAAAGGGGKGMRIVERAADLAEAVAAAKREAEAGFGDDRVFAERYVPRSRHVEIQLMGDSHGTLLHLGERECSIQRRHQKVIEEAPSPNVDPETRATMGAAAVRLGAALDYRSAGTVEFLVDADSGDFFFLEVNTRLQVEHPVTEEVTGRDLVRDQLRVALGQPLGYRQDDVSITGHAIEARLYAEDPANGFLPATGTLEAFAPAPEPSLRWDTGVWPGSVIGVDFDPMVAKVIAHGPDRASAAGRLALGLERLNLGGVVTNRDFLAAVLREPAFLAGDTTTDFIERVGPAPARELDGATLERAAVWAALWLEGDNRSRAEALGTIPGGFTIGRLPPQELGLTTGDRAVTVHYRRRRDGTFALGSSGDDGTALVHRWSTDQLDVEVDGRRSLVSVTRSGDRLHLTGPGGGLTMEILPRFPLPEIEQPGGAIAAPMPGKVLELRVAVGDLVVAGQVVAILEAMKMEHHLAAPDGGRVTEVRVGPGDQVDKDVLLMVIDAESGS